MPQITGIGRAVAEQALRGDRHPLQSDFEPIIDPFSMWGDAQSWMIMKPDSDD